MEKQNNNGRKIQGEIAMDENCILRQEHEEFARRIDAENGRQNRRIQLLEDNVRQISTLTVSVEKMAVNMENMLVEQRKLSDRMEAIEKEPAEMNKQIRQAIITSVVGTVVGAVVTAVLLIL